LNFEGWRISQLHTLLVQEAAQVFIVRGDAGTGLEVGKETRPRPTQMLKGLCVAVAVHVIEPREPVVLDGVALFFERHRVGFLPRGVLPVPLVQRPVPDLARRAAGAGEVARLFGRWTEGDLVGQLHGFSVSGLAAVFSASSSFFR
jgi:hypothetical protein